MASGTVIPVSEYLHTVYRPDCDYVDGVVEERHLGELDHSDRQRQFLRLLDTDACRRFFWVHPELRVQVSTTRLRIPDLCLRSVSAPREQILRTPPMLCIEVVSPEDTLAKTRKRAQDFFDMGVGEVWIVDPAMRTVYVCTATTLRAQKTGIFGVPHTPVVIDVADVFSILDGA